MAAVVTLRSASELVEALLAHAGAGRQIPSWAASCAHQAGRALGSMDHLIRELSEVALITFMCAATPWLHHRSAHGDNTVRLG